MILTIQNYTPDKTELIRSLEEPLNNKIKRQRKKLLNMHVQ